MNWLKGGPFYEISFLLINESDTNNQIISLIDNLDKLSFKPVITNSKEDYQKKASGYAKGYYETKADIICRNMDLNLVMEINGNRKAKLFLVEVSNDFMMINFAFYGSIYSSTEWNQLGIVDEDKPEFRKLLIELSETLNIVVGTIGYEVDVLDLFDSNNGCPNDDYSLMNLSYNKIVSKFNTSHNFEFAIVSSEITKEKQKYIQLNRATA